MKFLTIKFEFPDEYDMEYALNRFTAIPIRKKKDMALAYQSKFAVIDYSEE